MCFYVFKWSGLNINLKKSKMFCIGDRREETKLARTLGYKCIKFLIKYLGLSLGFKFKEGRVWDIMINLFERRLAG